MPTHDQDPEHLDWLNPYFLGAYAENDSILESVLVEFLRDHCCWRRNIHPEDPPLIPMLASDAPDYREFIARMKTELHGLSARLKNSVPFYNPRYIGHMASDLLLPGLFPLRHTLMNPWLARRRPGAGANGMNYLDRYCRWLGELVRGEVDQAA